MKKSNNRLWESCTRELGLETKLEKRWFIAAFILLFFYLWLCQYLRGFLAHNETLGQLWPVICSAIQVLPVCFFGVKFFGKLRIFPVSSETLTSRCRRFFPVTVFVLTFAYLLLWLAAYFPGGFSPDSINQYMQVLNGAYNNWHPVLHTWLFFWIPYRIFHHPAGIVFYQILLFSLAVWYLYRVLCRRGCPMHFMILSWLYLILNYQTVKIMLFPWKDSAMVIITLVIFTQIIEIYETQGQWLDKWYHFLSFSALCMMATVFRHNAILLTAPLYVILFVFQKKKRKTILLSGILVLTAIWFLNGPIMTLAKVQTPGNRQTEVLGLPMTVLSEVYMCDRSALPAKAVDFLDSIATQDDWYTNYQTGNFNSLKFRSSLPLSDLIEHEGARAILRYTVYAFLASPICALRGFATLTQMVWNPVAYPGWTESQIYCCTNDCGISYQGNARLAQALTYFGSTTDSMALFPFTRLIGMILLILLFTAVANIGRGKLGRAFMVLPVLIYDLGTMLLLTGSSFRFFHFNFVIVIPLLYLILSGSKQNANTEIT